jgi:hypothetical protein
MQKFYYYCPKNFYYTGCDSFALENSTTIAPPIYETQYFTAFFDKETKQWNIKPQILNGIFVDKQTGKAIDNEIPIISQANYLTIEELKIQKTTECNNFYEQLRIITIRNGAAGVFKCDQNLSNCIDSWIKDITSRDIQIYEYLYGDVIVHLPLKACIELSSYVAKVRNFCASLRDYHIYKITKLQNINDIDILFNYDYKLNKNGEIVQKFPDFIIKS